MAIPRGALAAPGNQTTVPKDATLCLRERLLVSWDWMLCSLERLLCLGNGHYVRGKCPLSAVVLCGVPRNRQGTAIVFALYSRDAFWNGGGVPGNGQCVRGDGCTTIA